MNSPLFILLLASIAFLISSFIIPTHGFVKMSLPKTLTVGSQLIIHGTSAPSNSTRTNCTVAVNINGAGYQATNMSNTTWTFTSDSHAIKAGDNRVTAKFVCFSPTNSTSPSFIHHHSENVTGVPIGGGNTTNLLN